MNEMKGSEFEPVRILVVDDEQVVRDVVCTTLEGPNTYLVETSNGEEAICLLLREPFDLVIADKNLPGITGMDVIRRAKAVDPNIGALLITAYASRESAEEAMAIGVDNYIEKPFGISELEQKVRDALERRGIRQRFEKSKTKTQAAQKRKVVICEPNETNRAILVEGIEILGHQPIVVSEVFRVIDALRAKQVDTLICNLALLHRDNARSCFLRSMMLIRPEVRFVVVSGERDVDGIVKAIHHGARKILYYPLVNGQKVAKELEEFLGSSPTKTPK